jgi:hypothetical protein
MEIILKLCHDRFHDVYCCFSSARTFKKSRPIFFPGIPSPNVCLCNCWCAVLLPTWSAAQIMAKNDYSCGSNVEGKDRSLLAVQSRDLRTVTEKIRKKTSSVCVPFKIRTHPLPGHTKSNRLFIPISLRHFQWTSTFPGLTPKITQIFLRTATVLGLWSFKALALIAPHHNVTFQKAWYPVSLFLADWPKLMTRDASIKLMTSFRNTFWFS